MPLLESAIVLDYCGDDDAKQLANNFSLSKNQLLSFERGLGKNPAMQVGYVKSFGDGIANGYMRKVAFSEVRTTHCLPQWYLLHYPVVNPNKPSEIRRVCNAAARSAGKTFIEAFVPGSDLFSEFIGS